MGKWICVCERRRAAWEVEGRVLTPCESCVYRAVTALGLSDGPWYHVNTPPSHAGLVGEKAHARRQPGTQSSCGARIDSCSDIYFVY